MGLIEVCTARELGGSSSGFVALCELGGVEGWGSCLCCVSGAPLKASSDGAESTAQDTKD